MDYLHVLIVDDNLPFRDILRQIVHAHPHWYVVAEADNGWTAIQLAQHHLPHVVLMDVDMPGMHGIAATPHLKRLVKDVRVVLLSEHGDDEFRQASLQAGGDWYLHKEHVDTATLTRLITSLLAHGGRTP